MNLEFGVPSQRKTKTDEYAGRTVLIMHKLPEGKKQSRRFELSNDAAESMGYSKRGNIAVSFDGHDMYLANIDESISEQGMNFTNNFTFSSAKVYKYVAKLYDLDTTVDNIFDVELIPSTMENVKSIVRVIPPSSKVVGEAEEEVYADMETSVKDNNTSMDENQEEVSENIRLEETAQ